MPQVPLRAQGIGVVRGGRALLCDIDLAVDRGELLVVVGPNGAGKTTLLRTLFGWITPDRGQILVEGQPVGRLAGHERAARLGWLPQRTELAEPVSVIDQVMAARFRFSESSGERRSAALEALAQVGLGGLAQRSAQSLSGGEAQRVGLAALIAQQARTWLLDEPANHLDPAVQHRVVQQVLAAWRAGRTVVVVTHDPDRVLCRIDAGPVRVLGLSAGRVRFDRSAHDDALTDDLSELYGVPMSRVRVDGRQRLLFGVGP